MNTLTLPQYTLFCPGPVNISAEAANAYTDCALSHREESFSTLLQTVQDDILRIAGISSLSDYTALLITGSGTAANESVLASGTSPDTTVIVLSNGEFGQRLAHISDVYNQTIVIKSNWGEEFDLEHLKKLLSSTTSSVMVAMVHHETSTGLLNPVEMVGRICKQYGAKLFVDAISSFAADPIKFEHSGITFLTTSSGKAIASYPGLSVVLGKNDHFREIADYPVRNHYLNLSRFFSEFKTTCQTPNTPAVPLIATLHYCLSKICQEGMTKRHVRLSKLAKYMRDGLKERELYTAVDKPESVVLTNARLPENTSFSELQHELKKQGFVIYNAKGPLQGTFFQVSTIGEISFEDIDLFLQAYDNISQLNT